jgi:SNF2 family DNA or RNA helicase
MEFGYRVKPFDHQRTHFDAYRDTPRRGLLWDMGTGKTKTVLDTFQHLFIKGEVDTLVVLAPNGVHRNWITDEVPFHLPKWMLDQTECLFWHTGRSHSLTFQNRLRNLLVLPGPVILAIPYTAIITKNCKEFLYKILETRKCFYVADEAHHFKAPNAKRSKTIHASCKYAKWRRILTGTPLLQGPFDAYSIMKFLDLEFWKKYGLDNFAMFKSHFGIFVEQEFRGGTHKVHLCVGYRNLEELKGILKEHCDRVLKDEVLDLPPKLYSKRYFELTKEQRRIYEELKEEFLTFLDEDQTQMVTAPLAITRLLRLQQVISGYIPTEDGENPIHEIPGGNPRLTLLEETIAEVGTQGIIFAKFRLDIDRIMSLLGPGKAVRYDGKVSDDQRAKNKKLFQEGKAQWFVANQGAAGEGLTLVQAKTVIYYNNTHNLGQRLQSEDRAHRPGQTSAVAYEDLIAVDSVDTAIVDNLRRKRDMAQLVLGDEFKTWL